MTDIITQRVELNLHTIMSEDSSVITPKEAIETALEMGLEAVAITDRNSVQSLLSAATCQKESESNIKVIYGAELSLEDGDAVVLARNREGLKILYKVFSSKKITDEQRKYLMIGCPHNFGELYCTEDTEVLREKMQEISNRYDYIELSVDNSSARIRNINKQIYKIGKELGITVVAVGNCHYIEPRDKVCKNILNSVSGFCEELYDTHFSTTDEMMSRYSYLGKEEAFEVVVTNPVKLADSIDFIDFEKDAIPRLSLPNAYNEVCRICKERLVALYGEKPHKEILNRLDKELSLLNYQDHASLWLLFHKLSQGVKDLHEGTLCGGTAGSTLVSYLLGATDVNPLPAHYHCTCCNYTEFSEKESGYDLPKKLCPHCNKPMKADGHNIPYETCMGTDGKKSLDINIVVSEKMCSYAKICLLKLFGESRIARVNMIYPITLGRAHDYVQRCLDKYPCELFGEGKYRTIGKLAGVKREERKSSYGFALLPEDMQWEEVTPVTESDDDSDGIKKTIHMGLESIRGILPKLNVLSYKSFDCFQKLCKATGVSAEDIDYSDPAVYELFRRGEVELLPEFSHELCRNILRKLDHRFRDSCACLQYGAWYGCLAQ